MKPEISTEFLASNGFKLVQYPNDKAWVRKYTAHYLIQISEDLENILEWDGGWPEQLSVSEFIETVRQHEEAINQ